LGVYNNLREPVRFESQSCAMNIKVAVRVRPFSAKESKNETCIIGMDLNGRTTITEPSYWDVDPVSGISFAEMSDKDMVSEDLRIANFQKKFQFDFSYWSHTQGSDVPPFSSQERVFDDLGVFVVENAMQGYNCSMFAYGQTGSGKTYTMMGNNGGQATASDAPEELGLIPRVCKQIFDSSPDQIAEPGDVVSPPSSNAERVLKVTVAATYVEIYNEQLYDLFAKGNSTAPAPPGSKGKSKLRLREKPGEGAFVEGLIEMQVKAYEQVEKLLARGAAQRTVASHNLNEWSSRSHAVFTLLVHCLRGNSRRSHQNNAKVCLVDLAGSERAKTTGCTGLRLREASSINRSLSTLSDVIRALADRSQAESEDANGAEGPGEGAEKAKKAKKDFIPWRNSVLTQLLRESLGGNSRTVMIAALSPCRSSYHETLSTLRYANRVKSIVTVAKLNSVETNPIVLQLRAELEVIGTRLLPIAQPPPEASFHNHHLHSLTLNLFLFSLSAAPRFVTLTQDAAAELMESRRMLHQLGAEADQREGELGTALRRERECSGMMTNEMEQGAEEARLQRRRRAKEETGRKQEDEEREAELTKAREAVQAMVLQQAKLAKKGKKKIMDGEDTSGREKGDNEGSGSEDTSRVTEELDCLKHEVQMLKRKLAALANSSDSLGRSSTSNASPTAEAGAGVAAAAAAADAARAGSADLTKVLEIGKLLGLLAPPTAGSTDIVNTAETTAQLPAAPSISSAASGDGGDGGDGDSLAAPEATEGTGQSRVNGGTMSNAAVSGGAIGRGAIDVADPLIDRRVGTARTVAMSALQELRELLPTQHGAQQAPAGGPGRALAEVGSGTTLQKGGASLAPSEGASSDAGEQGADGNSGGGKGSEERGERRPDAHSSSSSDSVNTAMMMLQLLALPIPSRCTMVESKEVRETIDRLVQERLMTSRLERSMKAQVIGVEDTVATIESQMLNLPDATTDQQVQVLKEHLKRQRAASQKLERALEDRQKEGEKLVASLEKQIITLRQPKGWLSSMMGEAAAKAKTAGAGIWGAIASGNDGDAGDGTGDGADGADSADGADADADAGADAGGSEAGAAS
jgi:kinesin family protein 16B